MEILHLSPGITGPGHESPSTRPFLLFINHTHDDSRAITAVSLILAKVLSGYVPPALLCPLNFNVLLCPYVTFEAQSHCSESFVHVTDRRSLRELILQFNCSLRIDSVISNCFMTPSFLKAFQCLFRWELHN